MTNYFCPSVQGIDGDLAENPEPPGGACGCEPKVSPVCGSDAKPTSIVANSIALLWKPVVPNISRNILYKSN